MSDVYGNQTGTLAPGQVATVTSNGVTVNANMTDVERFNAHLVAQGGKPIEKPSMPGQQFHTEQTRQHLAQQERSAQVDRAALQEVLTEWADPETDRENPANIAKHHELLKTLYSGGKIAPLPATPGSPESKLAAFDQEMRDAGMQRPLPAGPPPEMAAVGNVQVDASKLEQVNAAWRALTPEQREQPANKNAHFAALETLMRTGQVATTAQAAPEQQPSQAPTYTVEQAETAHKSVADAAGYIPLESVGAWATSGYTVPRVVKGQTLHSSAFADFAAARAAGLSQAQVDKFIRDSMTAAAKANGWELI